MVERITRAAMTALLEPYGLCEAVKYGATLTLSGQTGMNAAHAIVEGGLKAQALQAFRNIAEILALAGGATPVHFTWYLAETGNAFMPDALDVTAARDAIFPGLVCGATAVRVKELLSPQILVEIQTVAAL